MLSGVRIYTSDTVWRQILTDLNATVLPAPTITDLNLDDIAINGVISPTELKSAILGANDSGTIIRTIFGTDIAMPRLQMQLVVLLYKTGGMTADELKRALGYAPDVATHTIDTAIYQLRKAHGRDFIQNNNGVYKLGRI